MKLGKSVVLAFALLGSMAYAVDELNQVVDTGVVGVFAFDQWGEFDHDNVQAFGLGFKYGVLNHLEIGITIPFALVIPQGTGGYWGMEQIELGAKYRLLNSDFAGFINMQLPFGSKKILASDPTLNAELGVLMNVKGLSAHLRGCVAYDYYTQVGSNSRINKGSLFNALLRPGFNETESMELLWDAQLFAKYSDVDHGEARGNDNLYSIMGLGFLYHIDSTGQIEGTFDFLFLNQKDPGLNWLLTLQINKDF